MTAYGKFALIYDSLMRDVDYDAWAEYICGFLTPGCSVLECSCGTGEISVRLARKGYALVSTDISEDMLKIASEKARKNRTRIVFARMDMRELYSHKPVDAVIAVCDGVNYLLTEDDLRRFFKSARDVLKPSGQLLFDVSSEYKLRTELGDNTIASDEGDVAFIWQNSYDEARHTVDMELSFFVRHGELYEKFEETHIQKGHDADELIRLLNECGFEVTGAYDAFTRDCIKQDSERIQLVARRI